MVSSILSKPYKQTRAVSVAVTYRKSDKSFEEKMKILNNFKNTKLNKPVLASMILLGLLLASMLIASLPAQAQEVSHGGNPFEANWAYKSVPSGVTVDVEIQSTAFLSMSPNPIGLNQQLLVNMWLTFPSAENRFCADYTLDIRKPDGTTDQIVTQSYVADGTSYLIYNVDQTGTWQFKFTFPGEFFPAGLYQNGKLGNSSYTTDGNVIISAAGATTSIGTGQYTNYTYSEYYKPASTDWQNVTVQDAMVMSWSSALPSGYWTRPISPNNREWWAVSGNYPWEYMQIGGQWSVADRYYGPFITAPNSPHIVWKRTTSMSGLIGGETGQYSIIGGTSTQSTPSVIYMGRAYTTVTKSLNGGPAQTYAECYDIRTGEVYYDILAFSTSQPSGTGITPTHITYWDPTASTVPGEIADATFTVELNTIMNTGTNAAPNWRLFKINPLTGAVTANVSIPTFRYPEMMFSNGFYLSYDYTGAANTAAERGTLYNWSSQGSGNNFTARIQKQVNVTIPHSKRAYAPSDIYGFLGAYDPEAGITVIQSRFLYGNVYGYELVGVNLDTAQVLWNYSSPASEMTSAYRPTNGWARHGRYIAQMELGVIKAWDIRTGAVLWELQIPDYPWGEFWMYDRAAYDNLLLSPGYTGLWAINEEDGSVAWHYADPAIPFETPYTSNGTSTYSVQDIRVIDGKVYLTDNEHTPSQPATRGWGLICLNVTNGDFLWKLNGGNFVGGAAADGYLTASSTYMGQMITMGKGLSATTVSAPSTQITAGQKAMITGTVLDQSPAQPGTPCVSDESMGTWMDYLHFQLPIDGIFHNLTITGVPVSIDAVDPNGNAMHLGDTVSDMSGTFSFAWQPTVAGEYKITATFMGSESYGSSYAQTAAIVADAVAAPSDEPTNITMPPFELYIAGSTVAIIVAIVVVGLLLRKRA